MSNSHNMLSDEMPKKRTYHLRRRAEQVEQTRRRITEAAVELHRTVGPAATRVSEIAQRAGVERVTVYSHFPDDAALFAACSSHWRALHPSPDPALWLSETNGLRRARLALRHLYAWYRETEPMTANILRDAPLVPALQAVFDRGAGRYIGEVRRSLVEGLHPRGERHAVLSAAVTAATDFHFWRALRSLGDERAAELGARFISAAARS